MTNYKPLFGFFRGRNIYLVLSLFFHTSVQCKIIEIKYVLHEREYWLPSHEVALGLFLELGQPSSISWPLKFSERETHNLPKTCQVFHMMQKLSFLERNCPRNLPPEGWVWQWLTPPGTNCSCLPFLWYTQAMPFSAWAFQGGETGVFDHSMKWISWPRTRYLLIHICLFFHCRARKGFITKQLKREVSPHDFPFRTEILGDRPLFFEALGDSHSPREAETALLRAFLNINLCWGIVGAQETLKVMRIFSPPTWLWESLLLPM